MNIIFLIYVSAVIINKMSIYLTSTTNLIFYNHSCLFFYYGKL